MPTLSTASRLPEPPRSTGKRRRICALVPLVAMAATPRSAMARREGHALLPTVHFQFGVSWALGPVPQPEVIPSFPQPNQPRFSMDIRLSVPVVLPRDGSSVSHYQLKQSDNVILLPEIGYGYQGGERHLLQLGLGLGVGSYWRAFGAYLPRLMVGTDYNGRAIGFRHGLAGRFVRESFTIELSHQALQARGVFQHDILLMFGIADPANLLGTGVSILFDKP